MSRKLTMPLYAVAFFMMSVFSCQCVATARVAKNAVAIREIYADRTYSELACSVKKCTFTLSDNGTVRVFGFSSAPHGYRISVDGYDYFEGTASQPFTLSMEVACNDADYSTIPGADINQIQCALQFRPSGKSLVADQVRVSAIVAGRYVTRIRKLPQQKR